MPAVPDATLLPAAFRDLPGADLVGIGLANVAAGRRTVEASLAQLAPERLARVGVELATHGWRTSAQRDRAPRMRRPGHR